ncbi:MAG TPA: penicillin-binding protein, partial [Pseudomonas sp.]|nr:penicillin-binding protein [Pseudomonas sp.]
PFHVQRISLAQKRQINPCKRADYGVRPECPIEDKPPAKPSLIRRLVPGL